MEKEMSKKLKKGIALAAAAMIAGTNVFSG